MPFVVKRNVTFEFDNEFGTFRAWADDRHFSTKHVPNLRNFVDTALAQKPPDSRNTRIIFLRPARNAITFRFHGHGTEFRGAKWSAEETRPRLKKQYRTFRIQLDR